MKKLGLGQPFVPRCTTFSTRSNLWTDRSGYCQILSLARSCSTPPMMHSQCFSNTGSLTQGSPQLSAFTNTRQCSLESERWPVFFVSGVVALVQVLVSDRAGFRFKEQKQFELWSFGSSSALASLLAGLGILKGTGRNLDFLMTGCGHPSSALRRRTLVSFALHG